MNPSQILYTKHFDSQYYNVIAITQLVFISELTKSQELFAQYEYITYNHGKLKYRLRWKFLDVNCRSPRLFHYVKPNISATNSSMSLPLSRKQRACRQTRPKISFNPLMKMTYVGPLPILATFCFPYGPGPPRFVEVSWSHTQTHHSR
jgi:hypothetical protein